MAHPTRMLRVTALAAPLGALALSAQAADVVDTIKEQQQFSTLAEAIDSAGIAESLEGEGPYTVFAPTDQAFDRLPQEVRDALMKQENQDQLKSLLQYHVIEGQEITAKDALGQQTDVDTLAGDRLSVDGTGQMVLLIPAGLEAAAAGQTEVAETGGMPTSEHQQQVLATEPGTEQQQTMTEEGAMPSSPHQEQVLRGEQGEEQGGQPSAAQSQTAQEGAMPASPHQQQVLTTEPATGQQMTQESGVPSSPHQEQLLRGEQGEQQQGGQPSAAQQQTAQESGVPSSPHQQQVLATEPAAGQQQTMTEEGAMPSSPHQEQVLRGQQTEAQQGQPSTTQPQVVQESGVPSSPHQQQVLATDPATGQQPAAQQGGMPASPHQEQVLRGEERGEQQDQGVLREATVIGPDIQADNGVIHAVDAVLIPQSVLSMLEQSGTQ
jgi:uncharacterized surface protein with fasciclin (FAS1) repeats